MGKSHSFEVWHMINVAGRLAVWLEQDTVGTDSVRIQLSGVRLPADSAGRVSAQDQDDWRPLTATNAADVAELHALGEEVRRAEAEAVEKPLDTAQAMHATVLALPPRSHLTVAPRNLGNGKWAFCRYSAGQPEEPLVVGLANMSDWCQPASDAAALEFNTFLIMNPVTLSKGQILETCAAYTTNIPGNWDRVAWYTDNTRCPADGAAADSSQPNILVLKRDE